MAHEHWLVCPSHVLWRHNREACTGRECLRCVLHYRRLPQPWRYTGYLERQLRHVDAFIAMSEFSRQKHREFGFPRDMEVVSYFLPDLPSGRENQREGSVRPHARPYFLFVGRLERIKGLDEVIEIFRSYPDADLLVAGDGEDGARLQRLAAGVANIEFLGRVAGQQLEGLYRHALALIVPSVGFETFGIILIEAFRNGTPVLARRLGPFPEIVQRCGGGELFDGREDLALAIRRIRDQPERRAELALRARQGFRDHWSESAVVPRYLDIVRRAAAAAGRERILDILGR
jgi:glycosyltransferase involved in cell wall biosynthesis